MGKARRVDINLEKKVCESIEVLKKKACISRLIIGLSGGKDSLCLCELIKMAGITNVKYFNMEFLPNLRIQRDLLAYPIIRFNIPEDSIIRIPSEHFMACMRTSAYTWYSPEAKKKYPSISRTDVFRTISQRENGTIVTGVKMCDSIQMARMVNKNVGICVYPMKDWNLKDVLTFMRLRKIDIPALTKKGCRGVGITPDYDLLFIYENYYDDFLKIEKVFPFVRVIVYKYKYFDLHRTMRVV